jgi:hypothetical protein
VQVAVDDVLTKVTLQDLIRGEQQMLTWIGHSGKNRLAGSPGDTVPT